MSKWLTGTVVVVGIAATAWFGLSRFLEEPMPPGQSVVVDQISGQVTRTSDDDDQVAALAPASELETAEPTTVTDPASPADPVATDAPEPAPDDEPAPEMPAPEAAAPDDAIPRFDVVRVENDGQMVIAGTANPGDKVEILLDGEVIAEAEADPQGAFVAVLSIALEDTARQLQLRVPLTEDIAEAVSGPVEDPVTDAGVEAPTTGVENTVETVAADDTRTDDLLASRGLDLKDETASEQPAEAALEPAALEPEPTEVAANSAAAEDPGETPAAPEATGPVAEQTPSEPQTDSTTPASDDLPQPEQLAASDPTAEPLTKTRGLSAEEGGATASTPVEPAATTPAPAADDPAPAPSATADPAPEPRFAVSAPVIILPSPDGDAAPALVSPTENELALIQPGGSASGVVLDRIAYGETGDVRFRGRGMADMVIRIYGNAEALGTTRVQPDGTWDWSMARARAEDIALFRFDELNGQGEVISRIETPFTYASAGSQVLRQREVVVQKGDVLWRIAEQYYGEGLRYSAIYGANAELIRDPDLIYPGQVFSIPELVDAN